MCRVTPGRTVTAPPPVDTPAAAPGTLPEAFRGNGMWIWELSRSEGGNAAATNTAVAELGKTTCGACHTAFRGPEIKK